MRIAFAIVFGVLIAVLIVCIIFACRSKKAIGNVVGFVETSLVFPLMGNLIIIVSTSRMVSIIGYFIYFIGMDMLMYSMFYFTLRYCRVMKPLRVLRLVVGIMTILDVVQLLLNPLTHHAFAVEPITVYGATYYRLIPYLGQTAHRVTCYVILAMFFVIFVIKRFKTPRIYAERYSALIISMIVMCALETFFIFSRTPIDISMIAFGIYGITLYYFAIHYRSLRLLDRMLSDLVSDMNQAVLFYDAHGSCIWANDMAVEKLHIDRRNFDLSSAIIDKTFPDLPKESDWEKDVTVGSGEEAHYYTLRKQSVRDGKGKVTGSFLSVTDATEERRELERQKYMARHDSLTDLYNREYLYKRVLETIDEHPQEAYYVGFLNIRNFKLVNDIFGNSFGDYTLKCVADWMRKCVPAGGVYGRISGDLFGFLVPVSFYDQERLIHNLNAFTVTDGEISYSPYAHVGIYEIGRADRDVSVMFDRAHMALLSIKDDMTARVAYYDDNMRNRVLWEQFVTSGLPEAIEKKELRPYFQPIVDKDGKVVGAEALARWIHPEKGFLSPGDFIPVLEKNGMIADADRCIWRAACEELKRWKAEGRDLFLSVNISPKDFYFMEVADELIALTKEYDIDPKNLRVEITETVMMSDVKKHVGILTQLKEAGFIVEMDDFGSGYSSLNLLKDMPVDVLKIDMAFLRESSDSRKAQTIVHNIIKLSYDLSMDSLTEGVETRVQYEDLSKMGCHLFQGFYFAPPLPLEEFEEFCKKQ